MLRLIIVSIDGILKKAVQARLSLHLSKCHIVENHMLRLIIVFNDGILISDISAKVHGCRICAIAILVTVVGTKHIALRWMAERWCTYESLLRKLRVLSPPRA